MHTWTGFDKCVCPCHRHRNQGTEHFHDPRPASPVAPPWSLGPQPHSRPAPSASCPYRLWVSRSSAPVCLCPACRPRDSPASWASAVCFRSSLNNPIVRIHHDLIIPLTCWLMDIWVVSCLGCFQQSCCKGHNAGLCVHVWRVCALRSFRGLSGARRPEPRAAFPPR